MTTKTNGKWQLAFWVVTVFFVILGTGLTNAIVANDRIRASEDKDIRKQLYVELRSINSRLARIEAKLNIN